MEMLGPFLPSLGRFHNQVYSELGADAVLISQPCQQADFVPGVQTERFLISRHLDLRLAEVFPRDRRLPERRR
jgi:hypothetical protein